MGEQGNNFISYNNPELDRMLERAAEAYTEEDRLEAYLGIQEHLTDELPFISLYFRIGSLLADSRVHGIDSIGELSTFKNVEDWFLIR